MSDDLHLPESILKSIPWSDLADTIWPTTSFTLQRNIADYAFPSKLSRSSCSELLAKLQQAFSSLSDKVPSIYIPGEVLTAQEKEFLAEHFLSTEGYQNLSVGQAIVINPASHFLATINTQDHLTLQWIDCKGEWEKSWNELNNLETELGTKLHFSFSQKFGYLTANPKDSGTALTVSSYLHLPCLIQSKQLTQLLLMHKEPSVETVGMLGNMEELLGDFLILRNRYTLGLTEQTILRDLHITATKLILAERTLRQKYQQEAPAEIKDAVSRAYGLLLHSYQLQTKESLDAISKIKLGIDLGWIIGMKDHEINELFFRCRKAHLEQLLGKKELAHARAEYLHTQLKQATLTLG